MNAHLHAYAASSLEPTRENKKIYAALLAQIRRLGPTRVLEIGAGIGMLGDMISRAGFEYVGVEPDRAQLAVSQQRYSSLNLVEGSCYDPVERLALGKFDLVFSTDVIEHLYLPRELVRFCKAHTRPGGCVMTCTPEFGCYWKNILYSIFGKWDAVHSPLWDGGHIKFFSRKSMRRIYEEHGFCDFEWATIRNVNIPLLPMSMVCICRNKG